MLRSGSRFVAFWNGSKVPRGHFLVQRSIGSIRQTDPQREDRLTKTDTRCSSKLLCLLEKAQQALLEPYSVCNNKSLNRRWQGLHMDSESGIKHVENFYRLRNGLVDQFNNVYRIQRVRKFIRVMGSDRGNSLFVGWRRSPGSLRRWRHCTRHL